MTAQTILPANSATGAFEVTNSLRFNGSNSSLSRTVANAAVTNAVFSCWFKRSTLSANQTIYSTQAGNEEVRIKIHSDNKLDVYHHDGSNYVYRMQTNRLFVDPSAWYHLVIRVDTTNGTADNRIRIYINGTQETSFAARSNPASDSNIEWFQGATGYIGISEDGSSNPFGGYLAEVAMIDGSTTEHTVFGEFDEDTTTVWKPKAVYGAVGLGTNGWYLNFKDSSSLGNSTGNSNNFTANNLAATDQSTDTCTNNFCTMNPNLGGLYTPTFSEGNLQVAQSTNNQHAVTHGTFAVTKGVWYWEVKYIGNTGTSGPSDRAVGIQTPNVSDVFVQASYNSNGSITYYGYDGGEVWDEGTATTADYGTYSQNSILGISLDMDNGVISFYIDGNEVVNNYALGTSASVIATPAITWPNGTASGTEMGVNFGSPFYALSSAVADANGYGAFEYTPVGYALCTKNLAEFG